MKELSLPEFADSLGRIIPVIMKGFLRRQADELYKGRITLPQFLILEFLYKQGECKMTVLANFMEVTTAAMTGIVDRLARDGYIRRINEPCDRRIVKIGLTSEGGRLVKKIIAQRKEMIIKIFGEVSERDRSDYLRILTRIRDILTEGEKGRSA